MQVDVWSDIVCPWCLEGKRAFDEALAAFEHRDELEVTWHSFELDPGARTSFAAHRLLHHAAARGRQGELVERLLRAHFDEGEPIGDREVLMRLAGDAGLGAGEVRVTLASGRYAAEVRRDEALAQRLGIEAVPYFLLARRFGIAGAQPAGALLEGLRRAYSGDGGGGAAAA